MPSARWPRSPRTTASMSIACWCRPVPTGCRRAASPKTLKLAPNTLTFHFDRLRAAGLVTVRREGRSMIYAARFEVMNALHRLSHRELLPGRGASLRPRRLQARTRQTNEGHRIMKRMHVHVSVADIGKAVGFYSALFAAKPAVVKDDYAKWMLDDPRVNFAISTRGRSARPRSPRHAGRERRRVAGCLWAAARGRRQCDRGRQDHLLLRAIGKILDRRPGGNFLGDIFHHRRKHALRRRRREGRSRRPRQGLLRTGSKTRAPRLRRPVVRSGPWSTAVQHAVPVHRQFGALDHRRSDPEQDRQGKIPRLSAPAASPRGRSIRTRCDCCATSATTRRACARSRGANSPGPARRRSISSSRSATTPPPRPVRCGPASR